MTVTEKSDQLGNPVNDKTVMLETHEKEIFPAKDPNLRSLPVEVKKVIGEDRMEYVVKGDGPCLLRTTAAHLEGDEDKGIELARDLNTHQALNREVYKDKLSSSDFPMTVTIGVKGKTKTFTNADEYFDWLQEAKEASYMWRGCMDVMGICNMAQMNIDIIIHEKGQRAPLRSFEPDPHFPRKNKDKMRPTNPSQRRQGKMTVINWKDVHFNLLVDECHMLFQLGSFKFQEKNSKLTENGANTEEGKTPLKANHEACKKIISEKDCEIVKLKEKLKEITDKLHKNHMITGTWRS